MSLLGQQGDLGHLRGLERKLVSWGPREEVGQLTITQSTITTWPTKQFVSGLHRGLHSALCAHNVFHLVLKNIPILPVADHAQFRF